MGLDYLKIKELYKKNKIYSEEEISDIALSNGMITIDCLKDENMISVEEWDGKDLVDGVCLNLIEWAKISF